MKILLSLLLLLFITIVYSNDRPYEGITSLMWVPEASDIYLTNDNGQGVNGGLSPLYLNDATIGSVARSVGNIPSRSLTDGRLILSSSQGFSGVDENKAYFYYDNRKGIHYDVFKSEGIKLGGYYLVILYPFIPSKITMPYFSTTEGSNTLAYRIDDDTVTMFQSSIKNQIPFDITGSGFKYVPSNQVQMNYNGALKNEYLGIKSSDYLRSYEEVLKKYGVKYESLIFVQGASTVSTNLSGTSNYYPAILVSYGKKQFAYAMYGVWHDGAIAQKYGYKEDQKVYFTERQVLPNSDTYTKYPDIAILQLNQDERFGNQVFTEEQILQDKKKYFPLLAWRPFQAWSEMDKKKEYDAETGDVLKIKGTDEYPPNYPDNTDNNNGPGMTDCPDKEYYWDLYCQCVEKKLKGSEETIDSKKFQDYKDYLGVTSMMQQYDPTVYGIDRSTSPQTIETSNQPVEPAIYNKNCELLNGKEVKIYDPFAADATFYLFYRDWDWDWGHTGYFKKEKNVNDKFKTCLGDLQNVYDYFISNKGRQTNWSYEKVGNDYQKKWKFNGDVEVNISKPELLDSNWYIGNAVANYTSYETFRQFAVYDNSTAQGSGPFRLITKEHDTRDDDKVDYPDYRRYKNPWIGGDIPSENAWEEKDWFVQWEYTLVYKDKHDIKYSVGTLTFTTELWKNEDEDVMPTNFDWHGSRVNIHMNIGGKTPFEDPTTGYDKNSKDYRTDQTDPADRSPEAEIDNGDAMWEIARKIAVAELFDLAAKTVHNIAQRNDQAGQAATVAYEASKRLENSLMVRKTFDMAKDAYKGYVYWRETMDIIRDCRDTYNSISAAWDGLRTSAYNIYDYYKNLDFSKIRLTNITKLLPGTYLYNVDISLYCMQSSLADFNKSLDALAFQSDRLTRGNYGPFNSAIMYVTSELMQATGQSGEATTRFLNNTTAALNQVTQGAANTPANKAYLSNITKATYNTITNQRLMVMNERNRSAALGLFILQQEANDWITYSNHMKYASGNVSSWTIDASKANFAPIINGFQTPPSLFKDQGYWDELANNTGGK